MGNGIGDLVETIGLTLREMLTDRRGTSTVTVFSDGVPMVLKAVSTSDKIEAGQYEPIAVLENEIAVLREIPGSIYVKDGADAGWRWVLTKHIEGKSASYRAKAIREGISDPGTRAEAFRELTRGLRTCLRDFHRTGYVHGDIQPAHFLFDEDLEVWRLIDFGLSAKPNALPFPFRGAFVHFNAPEVCSALLEGSSTAPHTSTGDVYALGATLFLLITEMTIWIGEPGEPRPEQDVVLKRMANGPFRRFEPGEYPDLGDVTTFVNACLSIDPRLRPVLTA